MEKRKILLSGITPSGTTGLHIGNYFGAIRQFVELQDKYETYIFIANMHALTTITDKDLLEKNTLDVATAYLACGLDPEKMCLFKQSDIGGEVAELTWYFNCLTTVAYLERAHAFKDAHMKKKDVTVGLFDYPMLMAADILIQDADVVPVGADQKQHVEYARDTAQKFNNTFGETFKLPEPIILQDVAIVPGTDGRKMSKSYGNTIPLFGTDDEIKKAVMGIVTDSKSPDEPKNPDECNIFALHKLFLNESEIESLKKRYTDGGLGYKESKEMLLKEVIDFITPMREVRNKLTKDQVLAILADGKKKVQLIVDKKMSQIRSNVGVQL